MRFLLTMILCLFPLQIYAEKAIVKSGDHTNFTRFVAYTGDVEDWKVLSKNAQVEVRSDNWISGFDLSDVYTKIGNSRIEAITESRGALLLKLNCQCDVKVLPLPNLGIVIDVINAMDSRENYDTNSGSADGILWPDRHSSSLPRSFKFQSTPLDDGVDLSRKMPMKDKEISQQKIPISAEKFINQGRFRIQSKTNDPQATDREKAPPSGELCIISGFLPPQKWSNSESLYHQIGVLRNSLISNSGNVNMNSAISLAFLFTSFAMTTEARGILEHYEVSGVPQNVLSDILNILENKTPVGEDFLNITSDCPIDLKIWSLLSESTKINLTKSEISDIYEEFLSWPNALQLHLSNRLSIAIAPTSENASRILSRTVEGESEVSHERDRQMTDGVFDKLLLAMRDKDFSSTISDTLSSWVNLNMPLSKQDVSTLKSIKFQLEDHPLAMEIEETLLFDKIIKGNYTIALLTALDYGESAIDRVLKFAFERSRIFENEAKISLFSNAILNTKSTKYLTRKQLDSLRSAQDNVYQHSFHTSVQSPEVTTRNSENPGADPARPFARESESFDTATHSISPTVAKALERSRETRRQILENFNLP